MPAPVYLDYNATTPVAPEVADAIGPFLREHFGNPSSAHPYGRRAAAAVDAARAQVAALVGATDDEIVFTGCATEANNLALCGVARALAPTGKRHLVISAVEHPAVQAPAMHLREAGWAVSIVAVDAAGQVDPAAVAAAVRADTALVSIMHANNEIGTIQPIAEIARRVRSRGVLVHTDAAQSPGKIPVRVDALGADLLTLAGHKFYATKGVGALYVRRGTPLAPVAFGAGQERGLRPGTENVPAIVGLGEAARLAAERLDAAARRMQRLRDRLHAALEAGVPGLRLNGHRVERLPNTLNVSFPRVAGETLLAAASADVAASVGSACHAGSHAPSGVLAALGADLARATGAVRLSVGAYTVDAEVERAARALVEAWQRLAHPEKRSAA
ncbi:MAG: cysteine desulfurase [Burkholderiales bacterium]|nr:cysteine desulfurase [Burkholderiales bacterium]